MADNVFPRTPGNNFRIPFLIKKPVHLNPHSVGIGGGGVVFGGIHIGALNFDFLKSLERNQWPGSCLYLFLFSIIRVFFDCLVQNLARRNMSISDEKVDKMLRPLGRVNIPIYLLARLYLLVGFLIPGVSASQCLRGCQLAERDTAYDLRKVRRCIVPNKREAPYLRADQVLTWADLCYFSPYELRHIATAHRACGPKSHQKRGPETVAMLYRLLATGI